VSAASRFALSRCGNGPRHARSFKGGQRGTHCPLPDAPTELSADVRLRIAHIGSKGIPSSGGTERVVEALAVRQAAASHRVTVYGSALVTCSGWYKGARNIAVRTAAGRHAGPTLLGIKCALHAVLLGDYDIVHVHGFENGFVLPILGLRYPTVMTFHGRGPVGKWGRIAWTLMHSMEPLSMKCASVTTSVSLHDARELSAQYGRPVAHVPNGVDPDLAVDAEAAARLLARHGVCGGRFWLFCAARIVPSKGCLLLLKAYRRVPDAPPLVVVGDLGHAPDHAAELRVAAEGLDVHFVPLVSDQRVLLELLQSASAFLFPSGSEGMSMTLLEAMAYGGLVVASDIPANRDVIAESAKLVPAGDADAWINALAELRDASAADLAARRAAGKHRALAEFDWGRVTWAYQDLYERVLERPLRRG